LVLSYPLRGAVGILPKALFIRGRYTAWESLEKKAKKR